MKLSSQRLQFPRTTIRTVSYLLVLLPAALGFLYVHSFGVNVVYADSWAMVGSFAKLSSGTLGISDLLVLHQEHWILFPQIAMLLLGTMTEWNSVAEMYLTQTCLLGTLACFLLVFRDSVKSKPAFKSAFFPLLMIPMSLLVFSFVQHQNMLGGFGVTFVFAQTFGVLALYLLYVLRYEGRRKVVFAVALASAIVASFSSVPGLCVWPAGLVQLFIGPLEKSMKKVFIVLWGLAGLGLWIAYFIQYASKNNSPNPQGEEPVSVLSALIHPLAAIEYFLSLLGSGLLGNDSWLDSGLLGNESLPFAAGLLLACLALISLLLVYKERRGLSEYSFWISLLLWSFSILSFIVVGRLAQQELDLQQGLARYAHSRYTSYSILAIVGVYGLLATTALGERSSIRRPCIRTILLVLMSGTVLLSAGIAYSRGIEVGREVKESRERAAFVLSTYKSQPDKVFYERELFARRKGAEVIRPRAAILERLGYSVFSDSSKAQR
jgi:hypothetical protein